MLILMDSDFVFPLISLFFCKISKCLFFDGFELFYIFLGFFQNKFQYFYHFKRLKIFSQNIIGPGHKIQMTATFGHFAGNSKINTATGFILTV